MKKIEMLLVAMLLAFILFAVMLIATNANAKSYSGFNRHSDEISILQEMDQGYVVIVTAGAIIASRCDNVVMIIGGAVKVADRLGVNGDRLFKAMMANLSAKMDQPYEHDDIIPSVTRLADEIRLSINHELETNKTETCSKWTAALRGVGILE